MILSVSRRTDIPSLYTPWFFQRLKEGFVLVRNPMNPHQISRISLHPDLLDGIVFWSKNPAPLLKHWQELRTYPFYIQFTLTPYGPELEPGLPDKSSLVETFRQLADRFGPEHLVWRYDPILFTPKYDLAFHQDAFARLAEALCDSTDQCIFSFLDLYHKTERNMRGQQLAFPSPATLRTLMESMAESARRYGLTLQTCSESLPLKDLGINSARCIDTERLSRLLGEVLRIPKDPHQRAACGCAASIDIGAYHTCSHACLYCYANDDPALARAHAARHDPKAALLFGTVGPADSIRKRKVRSYRHGEISLF